jgi:hypothetical protein
MLRVHHATRSPRRRPAASASTSPAGPRRTRPRRDALADVGAADAGAACPRSRSSWSDGQRWGQSGRAPHGSQRGGRATHRSQLPAPDLDRARRASRRRARWTTRSGRHGCTPGARSSAPLRAASPREPPRPKTEASTLRRWAPWLASAAAISAPRRCRRGDEGMNNRRPGARAQEFGRRRARGPGQGRRGGGHGSHL